MNKLCLLCNSEFFSTEYVHCKNAKCWFHYRSSRDYYFYISFNDTVYQVISVNFKYFFLDTNKRVLYKKDF